MLWNFSKDFCFSSKVLFFIVSLYFFIDSSFGESPLFHGTNPLWDSDNFFFVSSDGGTPLFHGVLPFSELLIFNLTSSDQGIPLFQAFLPL